jgi:hypothetical protein
MNSVLYTKIEDYALKVGLMYIIGNFKTPLVSREQLNKQGVNMVEKIFIQMKGGATR